MQPQAWRMKQARAIISQKQYRIRGHAPIEEDAADFVGYFRAERAAIKVLISPFLLGPLAMEQVRLGDCTVVQTHGYKRQQDAGTENRLPVGAFPYQILRQLRLFQKIRYCLAVLSQDKRIHFLGSGGEPTYTKCDLHLSGSQRDCRVLDS